MEQQELDHTPNVFISYAWTSDSFTASVLELAKRLVHDGIDVVVDKWDLKEGQDKYQFMEKTVVDSGIDKVLIICNSKYTDRADQREGGVGDETVIITPEVYRDTAQTKFIPILFEKDGSGVALIPKYLGSRIYIDLSPNDDNQTYEKNYEQLLRNIWQSPQYEKPKLGKKPAWLDSKDSNTVVLNRLIQTYKSEGSTSKRNVLDNDIKNEMIERVHDYDLSNITDGHEIVEAIEHLLVHRNLFLDYLEVKILEDSSELGTFLTNCFEDLFNAICDKTQGWRSSSIEEPRRFLLWELFICTTALLIQYRRFTILYKLVNCTYMININGRVETNSFVFFRPYLRFLEESYKPHSPYVNKLSLLGELIIHREKRPILTDARIAEADTVLCQLSFLFDQKLSGWNTGWFPYAYLHSDYCSLWQRLISKKFCQEIMNFLTCESIDDFAKILKDRIVDRSMHINGAFENIPNIIDCVDITLIGSKQ